MLPEVTKVGMGRELEFVKHSLINEELNRIFEFNYKCFCDQQIRWINSNATHLLFYYEVNTSLITRDHLV